MTSKHDDLIVGWAEGRGKNLAKSKNKTASWGILKRSLKQPAVTPETRREFDKLSKDEQDHLKSINGWISGAQCKDGHRALRNILPRDLLTIDVDYAPAYLLDQIREGLTGISHWEGLWHSSRRHTPDEPRVRLFMPMSRKVTIDEYTAIVRFVAWKLDREMKLVDPVSFRPAQMMFKPSVSKDDIRHFFYFEQEGSVLDPDKLLKDFEAYFGDWRDLSLLPKHPQEELRRRADKAEDPRTKQGPVGVFCRTYDIFEAMEEFLPGVYIPGDEHSGHPRFTYAGSTSSNGAIVYDNGLFMYSHHGHDPICDMNVNAFDLVRIHLFGDLDKDAKEGTSPTGMPSYKALLGRLEKDQKFNATRVGEKFDLGEMFDDEPTEDDEPAGDRGADERPSGSASSRTEDADGSTENSGADWEDLFGDVEPEDPEDDGGSSDSTGDSPSDEEAPRSEGVTRPARSKPRKADKNWFKEHLEFTENAEIKSHLFNVATIVQNDPRLINAIWYNEFSKNIVLRKTIKTKTGIALPLICKDPVNGDHWEDYHDVVIRGILETPNGEGKTGYGMRPTKADLYDAITLAARSTSFHPIRDYLLDCGDKWDRQERIDTFLIRYLKLPDTPYHRQISRMAILASVTRIFEPGHKFDFAVIIQGDQGIGKSTLIKALYGEQWFGELNVDLGEKQKVAEEITGKWGVELPELGALHKADHNRAKAFMRRQFDDVRMAYDRRVTEFPRQCVCWGTTNDAKYLRDPTGNRSYWPAVTNMREGIDTAGIAAERDQLWGEAVELYFAMRAEQPRGSLPLHLVGEEALHEARRLQEAARSEELHEIWAAAISDWLDTPITLRQFLEEIGVRAVDDFSDEAEDLNAIRVRRVVFTREQAVKYALNKQHGIVTDHSSTQNIGKALELLKEWDAPKDPSGWGLMRRRVQGVRARWIERINANAADRLRGYEIIDMEEDEFDVV